MPDDVASMAYNSNNGHPWWTPDGTDPRGKAVKGLQKWQDMLPAAGLNWETIQQPVMAAMPAGGFMEVPGYMLNVRSDTLAPLGIVKMPYKVIPNGAIFQLLEPVTDKAVYETAGALRGGAIVWVLAKIGEDMICHGDWTYDYVLITTAHDGTLPLVAGYTKIRVVCANTMGLALDGIVRDEMAGVPVVRITHRNGWENNLKVAHHVLGMSTKANAQLSGLLRSLANTFMSSKQVADFVKHMWPSKQEAERGKPRADIQALREETLSMFDLAINNFPGHSHTGWTAYNAITQKVDWASADKRTDDPLYKAWLGSGSAKRVKALRWLAKNLLNREL